MQKEKSKILTLFLTFLKIGAFTFGGGYAMIPLIQREIVLRRRWITSRSCPAVICHHNGDIICPAAI